MESKVKARLKELKEEYRKGQDRLIALEQETATLSNTMLRISGAIQVLEELYGENANGKSNIVSDIELGKNTDA
jgi:predicted nuclease with TOPRIM domain